jgi:hypothetical protein
VLLMQPDERATDASDPFVAPASFDELDASAREASEALAAAPPKKPLHVTILQLCVSADLFFSALGLGVGFARVLAQGTVFRANPLVWLVKPVTVTALSLALVLSLSRSLPNALFISRFAGINWWCYVLYRTLASYADPRIGELQKLVFDGLSPGSQRVALGLLDLLLFLLILPLFVHAPTRAFLSGSSPPADGAERNSD